MKHWSHSQCPVARFHDTCQTQQCMQSSGTEGWDLYWNLHARLLAKNWEFWAKTPVKLPLCWLQKTIKNDNICRQGLKLLSTSNNNTHGCWLLLCWKNYRLRRAPQIYWLQHWVVLKTKTISNQLRMRHFGKNHAKNLRKWDANHHCQNQQ